MKSSLREKKRIKEDARHLPPVRRWFLLSATALSYCETPHFSTCCDRGSSSAGISVRKLILPTCCPDPVDCPLCHTQLQSQKPPPTLSSRILHKGRFPFCTSKDTSLEQGENAQGTPPLSKHMPPGKTTLKVCQLDWCCHDSQTSSRD